MRFRLLAPPSGGLLLTIGGLWMAGCFGSASAMANPVRVGALPNVLPEASGLAVSRREPGLLWSHNDHGSGAVLYALDLTGALRSTVRVRGAAAGDWEDLATFEAEGQPWILIADTGDNHQRRRDAALYVVPEPDLTQVGPDEVLDVRVHVRIPVRFPEGAQDCEAVAVDVQRKEILLLSKRASPPVLYRLPLLLEPATAASAPPAEAIHPLTELPSPPWWQLFSFGTGGLLRSWPTGLDVSADGASAAVVTYGDAYLFHRAADEDWPAAFARAPHRLPPHGLAQAEAVAFSADGRHLFVTSERLPAPLLRYELDALGVPPAAVTVGP